MKQLRFIFCALLCVGNILVSICHAKDITIRYNGSKAKVTQTKKDSVNVIVNGAKVNIERRREFLFYLSVNFIENKLIRDNYEKKDFWNSNHTANAIGYAVGDNSAAAHFHLFRPRG